MAKQTKGTENVTHPAEPLDVRLAAISLEVAQIEHKIETMTRTIEATPAGIAAAKSRYEAAFNLADDAGQEAARAQIRELNAARDAAAGEIVRQIEPLKAMQDRQGVARSEALEAARIAGDEFERAQRAFRDANLKVDAAGHVGSKLTGLVAMVAQYAAPATQTAVVPADAPAPTKPKCPRCKRTGDVAPAGEGVWQCTAGWHGPIYFRSDGEILRGNPPAFAGPARAVRTSY